MWENHKSQCHLKGHILRIHAHFSKLGISYSKNAVKITSCFVLNLFKAKKKLKSVKSKIGGHF